MGPILALIAPSPLSKSDILINEGTTSQISLKNSSQDCNFEHIIVKLNSSSTPELHNLHILSSAGVFKYLPFSIFILLLLILILTNVDIVFLFTSAHN